jgi:hypothetical protein
MPAVSSTLSRYLNAFISSRIPVGQKYKKLGIEVLFNGLIFFLGGFQRFRPRNLDRDYFGVSFDESQAHLNFGSVFSALPHPVLEATLELHLLLNKCCFTTNPADPVFIRFLSSFTSVETLTTQDWTGALATLLEIPEDAPIIFPSLRTLKMVTPLWMSTGGYEHFTEPALLSFLKRRKALAVPIQTLVVMDAWETYEHDLKLLDEISGLKVVWKGGGTMAREYICGEVAWGRSGGFTRYQ